MKNQGVVLCSLQDIPNIEGMIFVRITDILNRMLKAPLLAIGIVLAVILPIQYSFGSLRIADFAIYPDGTTHVSQEAAADPRDPELSVPLFGTVIDNFVAQDESGLLLSYEIDTDKVIIQTFGATNVSIDYDTFDLVSKKGKIWTFEINSPVDYTLTMPEDTVIVGMTNFPNLVDTIENRPHLLLPKGENQIDYFFGVSGPEQSASNTIEKSKTLIDEINNAGIKTPQATAKLEEAMTSFENRKYTDAERIALEAQQIALQEQQTSQNTTSLPTDTFSKLSSNLVGIATSIAAIGGAITTITLIIKRTKNVVKKKSESVLDEESEIETEEITQEMREDDKQLVAFLEQNGGQAFEKELRKKFLLPRTTMWRAVKRLERQGIIDIEKKDFQNLVKLKKREEGQ
jgi:uncharacterized membrane protein